ncbi:class III signal peptide-containing protein [Candidatus Micrarchaeota archaeon]|nr:class III signal peptide-containing protein [Candidatus Micrarchaeota archaeon]
MKAQVSLEYIFLLLVFLVVISISLSALYEIRKTAEAYKEYYSFQSETERVDSAVRNVCSMGPGSSFKLDIEMIDELECGDSEIIFKYSGRTISKSYSCAVTACSVSKEITVKNQEGKISVS